MTPGRVLPVLVVAACGGSGPSPSRPAPPPSPATSPAEPPRETAPPASVPWAGTFALSGTIRSSDCPDVYLAAKHLVLDPDAMEARADVVDRVYWIRIEGQTVIAEGTFAGARECGEKGLYERWDLAPDEAGFRGTLISRWTFPPCEAACTVVFDVAGDRLEQAPL
jgi:hypothetical protein